MALVPQAPKGRDCPLHRCDVSKVCHKCPWWIQLRGKDPQTGADLDDWNCSVALLPVLLIENAKTTRSVAAATETFRNEMATAHQQSARLVLALAAGAPRDEPTLIEGGK